MTEEQVAEGNAVLQGMGILLVLVLGIGLRFYFAAWPENTDMVSWRNTAALMHQRWSPYDATYYNYNYGPPWAWVLWLLWWLPWNLRWSVCGVLTAADLGIAAFLLRLCGSRAALLFWLCPVSMLITGQHAQFDCVAVLVGIWAVSRFSA